MVRLNIGTHSSAMVNEVLQRIEREHQGRLVRSFAHHRFLTVAVPTAEVEAALQDPCIVRCARYLERDTVQRIPEYDEWMAKARAGVPIATPGDGGEAGAEMVPNDPHYGEQWGPACVDAEAAWEFVPENHDVIVAIIDTGIDISHVDLHANINRDLDWDFVNNDDRPKDDMGHGTHCAGIIGALTDNGVGIAGSAQVTLVGLKALSQFGIGFTSNIVGAIFHAGDIGADFVNMSLGGTSSIASMHDAIQQVTAQGTQVIAAAGNSGNQVKNYPAAYPEVVGVSALTTDCAHLASFSSYGTENVELCAPGDKIFSTLPDHQTWWNLMGLLPKNYGEMSGTSMACPAVVGVAAGYKAYDPSLSSADVRALLSLYADDLGDPVRFGAGRVDYFPFED
jgi:subtilisin family serine protease